MSIRDIQRRLEKLENKAREQGSMEGMSDTEIDAQILIHARQIADLSDTSTETATACSAYIEARESGEDATEAESRLFSVIRREINSANAQV